MDSLLNSKNEFWIPFDKLNWTIADLKYDKSKFVEANFGPGNPKNLDAPAIILGLKPILKICPVIPGLAWPTLLKLK